MERFYEIAGVRFRVSGPKHEMYADDGILSLYRAEPGSWGHSFQCTYCDTVPEPEGELVFSDPALMVYQNRNIYLTYFGSASKSLDQAYMVVRREDDRSDVRVKRNPHVAAISPKTVLKAMEMEHQLTVHSTLLFHSAFIEYQGRAILFTAPSGIGKSTQARLWCEHRGAKLINGDRSAVKVTAEGVLACGVPFAGSSDVRQNVTLPLAAIVYIAQAPRTEVFRLTGVRAFKRIWEGCSLQLWNREDVERASQTAMDVAKQVPVYYFPCTPDESAVQILQEQLLKEQVL